MLIVSHGLEVVKALAERLRVARPRDRATTRARPTRSWRRTWPRRTSRRRARPPSKTCDAPGCAVTMRAAVGRLAGRSYICVEAVALVAACAAHERAGRGVQHGQDREHRDRARGAGRDRRRVFQVFRLERERLAQAEQPLPRSKHAAAAVPGRAALVGVGVPAAAPAERGRAVDGDHDRARADRPGGLGVLPRRRPARACPSAAHRPSSSRRRCSPSVGSARRCAGSTGSSRPRSASTCSRTPFDPELGHARDRDAGGAGAAAPPGEPRRRRPTALGRFLGRPAPVPVAGPQRGDRQGVRGAGTGEFLAAVRLPAAVLDQAYASRYARHFYADSELERFRRRWTKGPKRPAARAERVLAEIRRPGASVRFALVTMCARGRVLGWTIRTRTPRRRRVRPAAAPRCRSVAWSGIRGRSRPTRR